VVQHAQTQRQELKKTAPRLMEEITTAVGDRVKTLGEKLSDLQERATARNPGEQ
jgi:hypothetical protein